MKPLLRSDRGALICDVFRCNNSALISNSEIKFCMHSDAALKSINITRRAIYAIVGNLRGGEHEIGRERPSANGPFARVVSRFHIVPLYRGVLSSGLCYERNPIARVATQVLLKFCATNTHCFPPCTYYSRHSAEKPRISLSKYSRLFRIYLA